MTRILALVFGLVLLAVPAFAPDVDGKWEGMIDTPMGAIPVGFTFKTDGAALTGTSLGPDGAAIPIKNGKVDGNKISFTVDARLRRHGRHARATSAAVARQDRLHRRLHGHAVRVRASPKRSRPGPRAARRRPRVTPRRRVGRIARPAPSIGVDPLLHLVEARVVLELPVHRHHPELLLRRRRSAAIEDAVGAAQHVASPVRAPAVDVDEAVLVRQRPARVGAARLARARSGRRRARRRRARRSTASPTPRTPAPWRRASSLRSRRSARASLPSAGSPASPPAP